MRIALGIPMSLSKISEYANATLIQSKDEIITHISTDTRELKNGDLFIAIKGQKYSGEDFLYDAKKLGAYTLATGKDADVICTDGNTALLNLASKYAQNLPNILYRIAITGSVGKTTTKEFAAILLSTEYKVHRNKGNYNNEIGMPMSILLAKENTEILLMEMGMNHRGEISRLSRCLKPNIGLITNIGTAHIGNLGSREEIAAAKLEIKDGMDNGCLILPYGEPLLYGAQSSCHFSCTDTRAEIYLERRDDGRVAIYRNHSLMCTSRFAPLEKQYEQCLIAAVAVSIAAGVSPCGISQGISQISTNNIRQTTIMRNGVHFYLDCYNASYESVIACIKHAEAAKLSGQKHMLIGDILELGDMSEEIHYKIGSNISKDVFACLFLLGRYARHIAAGAVDSGFPSARIFINDDSTAPQKTADQLHLHCSDGDTVFMKASRLIRLERVVELFYEE